MYPYPGGAISDRIGSRYALTLFGLLATIGIGIWVVAPALGTVTIGLISIALWVWIFVGLVLAQAWKSFGLGATFAVVKRATDPSGVAAGFASTETFRRVAFLVGPVLAAFVLEIRTEFTASVRYVPGIAALFGVLGTAVQHYLYDASQDTFDDSFEGLARIRAALREMPSELRPLLVGDTLVRFANGMVYVFFVLVVTRFLGVGVNTTISLGGLSYAVQLSHPHASCPPSIRSSAPATCRHPVNGNHASAGG